jgi:hypothetical protein
MTVKEFTGTGTVVARGASNHRITVEGVGTVASFILGVATRKPLTLVKFTLIY